MRLRPRVIGDDKPGSGKVPVAVAEKDSVLEAIIKWIPVEVIGAYEIASRVIPIASRNTALWIVFILLTGLWILFAARDGANREAWPVRQALLSMFAFVVWTLGTDAWLLQHFKQPEWYGTLAMTLGVLLLPILDGALKSLGFGQAPQHAS